MLSACLMMSLIASCKSGKNDPLSLEKELCAGSYLMYFDHTTPLRKEDKVHIIVNNRNACDQCYNYLTFDEQQTCNSQ